MRSALALVAVLAAGVLTGPAAVAVTPPDPVQEAIDASAAPGHSWTPGPAEYGESKQENVPVTMADGTVLRATVDTPLDKATGQPAAGPFPVLLTQTPYGNQLAGQLGSSAVGVDPYFVSHGYIDVSVDVRGTGNSAGSFDLFDTQQTQDAVAMVNWAAGLPHANGTVGLHGASYLGINQLFTAAAVGKNSPLKAIFPLIAANDTYRDTAFMGGIPDAEFDLAYLGALLPLVNLLNPAVAFLRNPADLLSSAQVLAQHLQSTVSNNLLFLAQAYLGGPNSYDNQYWHDRAPQNVLRNVVANGIPAYLVGGEHDIFQRGEPLNYAALQNAWAGKPTTAPMSAGQPVTGRYQLLDGDYTHLQLAVNASALEELQLKWFDTWLKGADTGMGETRTPLHYYDIGTGHYAQTTTYPLTGAKPTTYYFSGERSGTAPSRNDGTLTTTAPLAGADQVSWAPVSSSICDRSADQWIMGAVSLLTANLPSPVPCLDDDRAAQTGPTALTYTTEPMSGATTLAGPISATLYASATTTQTEWVVNVEDVAPDGTSKPLTEGALLGSARAVDSSRSWTVDGKTVLPYHPYTAEAEKPVVPGAVTKYDVEVFPTYATIAAGHRVRVTVNTNDFPHLLPTPPQLLSLLGGGYQVQHTAAHPSSVTLPLISAS
ncbi:CocE/NonD family hydrolase [Amycolatopsis acidicola]|uniref:CocE/NonD family hydrolase n=1 Tax=Amycolatopsis acidicola TaxID=2596893 RepID=A0A5N0UTR7_9PSEU|nr:CocE/NonD family hydrolase [Amycolatopsis acidicola]KAA9155388.1 CocE/NonD family hydrolase [Amycolatopsis acidicola]